MMFLNGITRVFCFLSHRQFDEDWCNKNRVDIKLLKQWTTWATCYPPAFISATLIFTLAQWEYLSN